MSENPKKAPSYKKLRAMSATGGAVIILAALATAYRIWFDITKSGAFQLKDNRWEYVYEQPHPLVNVWLTTLALLVGYGLFRWCNSEIYHWYRWVEKGVVIDKDTLSFGRGYALYVKGTTLAGTTSTDRWDVSEGYYQLYEIGDAYPIQRDETGLPVRL